MTYREQAMDAGYTGDELEQVAQMLEWEDQVAQEQYWKEQQQIEEALAIKEWEDKHENS